MLPDPICLRVKGPFACFTRPEFHVERVSYPVITPSAARGILEAILMKPIEKPEAAKRDNKIGFRWRILRLGIVRKGVLVSILRNELGYQSHPAYGNDAATGFDINETKGSGKPKNRQQRHSLILSGGTDANGDRLMLEYLIEAVIEVPAIGRREKRNSDGHRPSAEFLARNKYHQMFLRRAAAGQCYYQPFFGCREFSVAEWTLEPASPEKASDINEPFGCIFRDFKFDEFWPAWDAYANGQAQPPRLTAANYLRNATAKDGWIEVARRVDAHHVEDCP
jgi:CRISPR-associated protein Cas5d